MARTQIFMTFKLKTPEGNIFYIMSKCANALKDAGCDDMAKEMIKRVTESSSYEQSLDIIKEYINVTYIR